MIGHPEQLPEAPLEVGVGELAGLQARAAARSASVSPRNSSRTVSGASPSASQNASNAGQMLLVSTPPKSTTRAIGFPAMAEQATQTPEGIDAAGVERWFAANVEGFAPPLSYERISGGRSNLTYSVSDAAGGRWALRRPPLGKRLASAHDMGREFRIISALQGTDVPVAPAVGLSEDGDDPFYVMDWVEGPILRNLAAADLFPDPADRRAIGERVIDTLVAIHGVDPDEVGIGEMAKKADYVARQLHRWQGQWQKQHTRELPLVDEVHDRLAARIPAQGPATIVHGDYRLDNMILSPGGEVAAVVDWELCTLGDPLADVGLLLVYWGSADDDLKPLLEPATLAEGFPARDEVAGLYAERSGRDVSEIDYYVALALWKLAIILEGVFARYRAGQYGEAEETREGDVVEQLVRAASDAEARLG